MAPRKKLRRDVNETAFDVVRAATGEADRPQPPGEGEPNPEAVARGSRGGKKGGVARAKALSADERAAIGRKGAEARWPKEAKP